MTSQSAGWIRGLSFGGVADLYEKFRLGYPDETFEAVVDHTRRPIVRALEVGAGTGKATALFAGRGVAVTALEPDPQMARLLAVRTDRLPVTTVSSTFEQFESDRRFDLLYSASAWHWTDPATRWDRAARMLEPGGVLALLRRRSVPVDPVIGAALAEAQRGRPRDRTGTHPWTAEDIAAAEGLTDHVHLVLPFDLEVTAEQFVGRLSTLSGYLMLDADARAQALGQARAALPDRFTIDASVELDLVRRR